MSFTALPKMASLSLSLSLCLSLSLSRALSLSRPVSFFISRSLSLYGAERKYIITLTV